MQPAPQRAVPAAGPSSPAWSGHWQQEPAASVTITVAVSPDLPVAFSLVNRARTGSTTPDPDLNNNVAVEDTEVLATASFSITKSSSPNPVVAGQLLTYTVLITNNGPATATERARDRQPYRQKPASSRATASNGSVQHRALSPCSARSATMRLSPSLSSWRWTAICVRVTPSPTPSLPSRNSSTRPVPIGNTNVTTVGEWSISRSQNRTFLTRQPLAAHCAPDSRARSQRNFQQHNLSDTLPTNVTFIQATLGFNCIEGPNRHITCTIPTLPAGQTRLMERTASGGGYRSGRRCGVDKHRHCHQQHLNTTDDHDLITTTVKSGTDLKVVESAPPRWSLGNI